MVVNEEMSEKDRMHQSECLKQMREILHDILEPEHDDEYLLRFLVARKFNVDSAATMLKKHIQKFKSMEYDKVLQDYTPPKGYHYYCYANLGFDNEGSLVTLIAESDYIGIAMSVTKADSVTTSVHHLEKQLLIQKKEGKGRKLTYILDLECLTWRCLLCKPLARNCSAWMRMFEANYPETLKMIYVINAPHYFEYMFHFLEKYLTPEILAKVTVLSPDQAKTELTDVMDPSILPAYIGGTKTDPNGDARCYSLFQTKPGTCVPEEYYIAAQAESLDKDPDAKKVTIKKRSKFVLTFLVDTPETIITWDFKTTSNDIGIGLHFKALGKAKLTELIPVRRVNSHKFIESGRFGCRERGTYELTFSNLYSVLTKKHLTYKTNVIKPEESKNRKT